MFWQSGDKVYLKHTHQWGVFARLLDGDMAMVFLADQEDEIPVHLDDLDYKAPASEPLPVVKNKPHTPGPPMVHEIRGTFQPMRGGIFLAMTTDPEEMESRKCYFFLVNDSPNPLFFIAKIRFADKQTIQKDGHLVPGEWIEITAIAMDRLHQQPEIEISSKERPDISDDPPFLLKPRPKSMFQKMAPNAYFHFPAALYPFALPTGPPASLAVHTRRLSPASADRRRVHATPAPSQKALFKTELDLHADQLFNDPRNVLPADIFRRQMETFEHYLQKAIQIGVPHVYIIHGLGKGKLRQAIADRSMTYKEVAQVRNDYHPKYGFGASEIILH